MTFRVGNALPLSPGPGIRPGRAAAFVLLALLAISAGLVALAGPYSFDRVLLLQLVLIGGTGATLFLLHWPQAGIFLLLLGGLLVGRRIGTGGPSGLNGAFLMVPVMMGVWVIHRYFRRDALLPLRSTSIVPLYVFLSIVVLAFLVGQYPWFPAAQAPLSAQAAQLCIFLFLGFIFMLSAVYMNEARWLEWSIWAVALIGTIHMAIRLMPELIPLTRGQLALVVQSGSMFWTWLIVMAFAQFFLNRELHPVLRLFLGAVSLTALGITLIQTRDWLSGWFPASIAVGVVVFLRFPRATLLTGMLLGGIALVVGLDSISGFVSGGDNLYSAETRMAAIESLLPIISANPVLGVGPANYYAYTSLFPILGWYVSFSSHNNYLDLVAQTGVLGLAGFFWFFGAVGWTGWILLRSLKPGSFDQSYVYGCLGGLVATLAAAGLGDWVIPFVYNAGFDGFRSSILPWFFLGGLVAMERRMAARSFKPAR